MEEYPVDSYVEGNSAQQGPSSYAEAEAGPPYNDGTAENADGEGEAVRYAEVSVTRITHSFRADEYIFKDSGNNRRSTTKDEWEQIQYNGDWAWAYRGREATYISKSLG